jgi:hypothetical protein
MKCPLRYILKKKMKQYFYWVDIVLLARVIVWLYKNFIQINKVTEHNWTHISCHEIKYLDLYLSLGFFNLIFTCH